MPHSRKRSTRLIWSWCARASWIALPVVAGGALDDALDGWERAPASTAALLAWCTWGLGLVALLAPRPWGFTVLRVAAPALVATAAWTTGTGGSDSGVAFLAALVAAVLALGAPVADAAANRAAYGDERRFPLRAPLPLLLAPVPLAVAATTAGVAIGPLLLADGRWAAGVVAVLVGLPLAALALRSLHVLARRWCVVVPAGMVIADPLTLVDPSLVVRERVGSIARTGGVEVGADALDLRLGTALGSVLVTLREPVTFARRRGRRDAEVVETVRVAITPLRPSHLLAMAAARRIGARDGQAATPPPSKRSPS